MNFADKESDILDYIDGIKSPNFKATYTDKGFEEAMRILFASSRTTDPQVAKVIFLLTDGIPTVPFAANRWVSGKNRSVNCWYNHNTLTLTTLALHI